MATSQSHEGRVTEAIAPAPASATAAPPLAVTALVRALLRDFLDQEDENMRRLRHP
jgi:hypothetical protein